MNRTHRDGGVVAVALAAGLLLGAAPVRAADVPPAAQPLRKLSRGLANGLGGVFAIPATIAAVGQEEGPLAGLTWGLFVGIGEAITRTAVGVAETFTFLFPLPQYGYEPILQPEFLFQPG